LSSFSATIVQISSNLRNDWDIATIGCNSMQLNGGRYHGEWPAEELHPPGSLEVAGGTASIGPQSTLDCAFFAADRRNALVACQQTSTTGGGDV
jgi:hypothetical protein